VLLGFALLLAACSAKPSGFDDTAIDTSADPEQGPPDGLMPFRLDRGGYEFTLTPLATYTARGVVLGEEGYSSGWNSLLAPCDVALAWGSLLEGDLYREISWSQSGRWYWWEWEDGASEKVKDERFVARWSANTHIIPADDNLRRAAKGLRSGTPVELSGYLVKVDVKKGDFTCWWTSSTSRQDTGDGSCEVLYLMRLKADGKIYE
jgi:hypothetical protein